MFHQAYLRNIRGLATLSYQLFCLSAIGEILDMEEINGIVSNRDNVFNASAYGVVQDLTDAIADKICCQPLIRKQIK